MRPDPAALIRAGRTAFRPQVSDRERVLQSLTRALGDRALLDGSHHGEVAKNVVPSPFPVRAWVLGGLGALVIGGTVVVAAHPRTTTPSQAPVSVALPSPTAESAPSAIIARSPNAVDRTLEPLRAQRPSSTERSMAPIAPMARTSTAPFASDSLHEEVRLLSRAAQQLNAGHADEALRTLAQHEQRFPDGALAEERMAARVQSLCALGRLSAARANLEMFARAYPRSAHLDRARRFCVVDAP